MARVDKEPTPGPSPGPTTGLLIALAVTVGLAAWLFVREEMAIHGGEWPGSALALTVMVSTTVAVLVLVIIFLRGRERRGLEDLYRAERARSRELQETAATLYAIGDAVISTDARGHVTRLNRVAEELTGFREAEAVGRPADEVFRIIHEETRASVASPIERVLREGAIVGLANHTLLLARDGQEHPIDDSGAPIRDESGEIFGAVLVFRDIATRRRAEALLDARLHLLEYALDHTLAELLQETLEVVERLTGSVIGFFHFVERDQRTLSLQAWSRRTEAEFCRAEGRGLHYDVDQAGVWIDCVREGGPVIHNDYASLPHKKGLPEGHAPVSRELVVPITRHGRLVAILGVGNKPSDYDDEDVRAVTFVAEIAWDLTERRRTEERLRALSARHEAILQEIPDIIMEVDENKVYTWANPAGYAFFGDDVVGREAADFFLGEQTTYEAVAPLFNGNESTFYVESWQRRRDGERRLLGWWCRALTDEHGRVTGALSTARDLTDERSLGEQLRQAQKMEAVGQLAGGVAHDFNNLLAAMTLQLELVQITDLTLPAEVRESLDDLVATVRRAGGLAQQLLLFSRRRPMKVARVELNALFGDMERMLRRVIEENVELEVRRHAEPIWVEADATMVQQIAMNLCINARDAMPKGGRLTVALDVVERRSPPGVGAGEGGGPRRVARLRVSDTGHGVPLEAQDRIFEPFFTTKGPGKGTGLGLATVHGIVGEHHGWVEVQSEPGAGATFSVFLPATQGEAEVAEPGPAEPGEEGQGARILVVEDEATLRRVVARSLARLGFTSAEAGDGEEALRVWQQESGRFDLVVTDMVMPGPLSGLEVIRRLREEDPTLRAIITTGYSPELMRVDGVTAEGIVVLRKPFEVEELSRAVRSCLRTTPVRRS